MTSKKMKIKVKNTCSNIWIVKNDSYICTRFKTKSLLKGRRDRIQALRGKEDGKGKESGKYLIFIRKGRLERLTLSSQKQN